MYQVTPDNASSAWTEPTRRGIHFSEVVLSESLFGGFEWQAPAGKSRYCWTRMPVRFSPTLGSQNWRGGDEVADEDSELLRSNASVLSLEEPAARRTYFPLADETGLFRVFAETDLSPEAVLDFANRYGPLGLRNPEGGVPPPEALRTWRGLILEMRYLVRLWDEARRGDAAALAQSVGWDERAGGVIYRSVPEVLRVISFSTVPQPQLFEVEEGPPAVDDHLLPRASLPLAWGDTCGAALYFVQEKLNRHLGDDAPAHLVWSPRRGRSTLRIMPQGLWGALCLQFARAVSGDLEYQRCPVCGRWFELSPGVNRANKQTCSGSCRTKLYRQRQERARELYAEGKTARQIARELGAEPEKVKDWVRGTKRKGGRP
jgi:hypothetical protein